MATPQAEPDLDSAQYRRCAEPRAYFAALRAKGPIDAEEGFEGRVQVLTHEAGSPVLHDPARFSSGMEASQHGSARPLIPLQVDPPDHARYRRLLDPVFSRKGVQALEGDVARLSNDLIDAFASKGACDFTSEFSALLPSAIFLRLLGLPLAGLDDFLDLKERLIRAPGETPEERLAVRELAGQEVYALFEAVVEQRSAEPRDDIVTTLVDAEVDGERLSREEVLDICYLLLMAGLDTVAISLQCMIHHLATHPEDRRWLAADLSRAPQVVEELLRWETPVQGVTRVATGDVEVAGRAFPAGTRFQVMLASINTDPATAEGFDRIDFQRANNRHLAFGGGIHRCLGSHLARLELNTAMREWHRRLPEYGVDQQAGVVWNGAMLRGLDRLPLVWEASA